MSVDINKYFPSDEFEVNSVRISVFDKVSNHCVDLVIKYQENLLHIDYLNKCSGNGGAKLLNKIEQFAFSLPSSINKITLQDVSSINLCKTYISCSLANLYLLTTGESWYNKFGFKSDNYENEKEHNRKVIELTMNDAFNKMPTLPKDEIINSITYLLRENSQKVLEQNVKSVFTKLKNVLLKEKENCDDILDHLEVMADFINGFYLLEYSPYLFKDLTRNNILTGGKIRRGKTRRGKTRSGKTRTGRKKSATTKKMKH